MVEEVRGWRIYPRLQGRMMLRLKDAKQPSGLYIKMLYAFVRLRAHYG